MSLSVFILNDSVHTYELLVDLEFSPLKLDIRERGQLRLHQIHLVNDAPGTRVAALQQRGDRRFLQNFVLSQSDNKILPAFLLVVHYLRQMIVAPHLSETISHNVA